MSNLTDDQLKLIEENRQKALKLKQQKHLSLSKRSSTKTSNSVKHFYTKYHSNNSSSPTKVFSPQNDDLIKREGNEKLLCKLVDDDRFVIICKYNPKLIAVFKSIKSRRYEPETKAWTFLVADFSLLGETKIDFFTFFCGNIEILNRASYFSF